MAECCVEVTLFDRELNIVQRMAIDGRSLSVEGFRTKRLTARRESTPDLNDPPYIKVRYDLLIIPGLGYTGIYIEAP